MALSNFSHPTLQSISFTHFCCLLFYLNLTCYSLKIYKSTSERSLLWDLKLALLQKLGLTNTVIIMDTGYCFSSYFKVSNVRKSILLLITSILKNWRIRYTTYLCSLYLALCYVESKTNDISSILCQSILLTKKMYNLKKHQKSAVTMLEMWILACMSNSSSTIRTQIAMHQPIYQIYCWHHKLGSNANTPKVLECSIDQLSVKLSAT